MSQSQAMQFPVERRRHPRTQLQMTLQAIRLDPDCGDVLDCLSMVDISRNGMGAYSQRPYYPGQRIVLCLPLAQGGRRRNVYARVVRAQQTHDGHRIGLEFDNTSSGSWCGYGSAEFAAA